MFKKLAATAPRQVLALSLTLFFAVGPMTSTYATAQSTTATPIQHLVIIFQENVSFDHYFGTYPTATNPAGEPKFTPEATTPSVNGLNNALLTFNPNRNPANTAPSNPFRFDRSQAVTSDQDHGYTDEQKAFDSGLMDLFPNDGGRGSSTVMGYFDGNTVTAMWNYAQFYAMSDNSYGTTFGPSTPGLINLVAGQTNGIAASNAVSSAGFVTTGGTDGSLTLINDADPLGDVCSNPGRYQVTMGSQTIGDLLSAASVSWGSFMGGFDLTVTNPNLTTGCQRSSAGLAGTTGDYIPHHSFFNYFANVSNPNHTRPASSAEIGNSGPANHNYDIHDFFDAINAGNFPAVSFLKAPAYQDGHAGYSDPLDEQTFLVNTLNFLQARPEWSSTAVVIMYDDSDGWYDHQMGPILNTSATAADALTGPGACGTGTTSLPGLNPVNTHAQGRCGYGPRQPMLVLSPYSKPNFVDHSVTDQSSIIRFVEDNWLHGQRIGNGSFDTIANSITQMFNFNHLRGGTLILNPNTGAKH